MDSNELTTLQNFDLNSFISSQSLEEPSSTAQGTKGVSFQRWYNFKEAFSPKLVSDVVNSMDTRPRHILDPFGGSGTTAVTSQFLGARPTTIEVNPFLADLIESKLTQYSISNLRHDYAHICDVVREIHVDITTIYAGAPKTLFEPGNKDRWIFDRPVIERIAQYLEAINQLNENHKRLFKVVLGATLIGLSNVHIDGKGRRYRKGWENRRKDAMHVDDAFQSQFEIVFFDICKFPHRAEWDYELLRGDSRDRIAECNMTDLCLFSPPYPNSFDYTDIYNVELWALGYFRIGEDNRNLREATLRSHVSIVREQANAPESETLLKTLKDLNAVRSELWSKHIPEMVGSYFSDMARILAGSRACLSDEGEVVAIVGDSCYANVYIDVPRILSELAPRAGLIQVEKFEVRSMRSSAQQGRKKMLGEWLLKYKPVY
ncbi:hypothetical protein [Mariprofundus sp. EBB-1]|uniref:hypothetical protein n=1 Tax=Mariprofundus sp. EBB-1 TaxID=2650971 RepID=UPI0019144513|nr:hypothetical protein [Mariprofundus sp. EBB-1]